MFSLTYKNKNGDTLFTSIYNEKQDAHQKTRQIINDHEDNNGQIDVLEKSETHILIELVESRQVVTNGKTAGYLTVRKINAN
jgi:hypothetical protein